MQKRKKYLHEPKKKKILMKDNHVIIILAKALIGHEQFPVS